MKILHIGPSGLPILSELGGAVQRRMWELAREQVELGHDVTILSPGDVDRAEMRSGVRVIWLRLRMRRPLRDYEFLASARRWLRRVSSFDILHAHGSPEAARFLGSFAESSVQTVDYFRYRATSTRVGHAHYTRSLNRFDAVMPVSDFCAMTFRDYYPRLRSAVTVVPNGVDIEQFRPDPEAAIDARAALSLPDGPLVVYLGRVCAQKGSDLLGPLSDSLAKSRPDAAVVAVGPPEQFGESGRSPLMEELTEAGVVCTGAVHERYLRGILNAATLVVLPTRQDEMFGMAALEAIACGTPVVASDLGGIPEAVGQAGILFPAGNAQQFAHAVGSALDDADLLHAKVRSTLRHAAEFAWPGIALKTDAVYQTALEHV